MSEVKEIPGFNGRYGITIDGQIWNYISKRFLKITRTSNKYYRVNLCKCNSVWKCYYVQRLVAATWGILDLNNKKTVVHHINGDPLDNHINNLQIMDIFEHYTYHNCF